MNPDSPVWRKPGRDRRTPQTPRRTRFLSLPHTRTRPAARPGSCLPAAAATAAGPPSACLP